MSKVRIEVFVSVPPCSGGVAVKRLLKEIEAEFGDQVEIVFHTGPGDEEWEKYAIGNAPALVIGDLVKFVGLAPSKESLSGALREAGLT
ncbi:MAG: thioredoxin family protein [Chloroflexota bacterium]|nr:thioredoxin family protein [Chloroflexota bacterium]